MTITDLRNSEFTTMRRRQFAARSRKAHPIGGFLVVTLTAAPAVRPFYRLLSSRRQTTAMVGYPKTYGPESTPRSVRALVADLLPRLLEGDDPNLEILRQQLRQLAITEVEFSGVGFFAHFAVPLHLPTTKPLRIVGGDAKITLSGVDNGAGCVLFIDEGRLSMLEGYTYGGEEWDDQAEVITIRRVEPVVPGDRTWPSDAASPRR